MKVQKPCRWQLLTVVLLVCGMMMLGRGTSVALAQGNSFPPEKVPLLSTSPMMKVANELGMDEILGKAIDVSGTASGSLLDLIREDKPIGIHPTKHENEPTVVANPKNRTKLVAGSHYFGLPAPTTNVCVVYTSSDGGQTWSAPMPLPFMTPASSHSDPVLAYSPDGDRVYYACMDIKPGLDYDIVVFYSDDDGQTWTGPIVALDGQPGQFVYDKPWIGTHNDDDEDDWVYVTATQFDLTGSNPDHIAFARSGNKGQTWSGPTLLDAAVFPIVVQGSRPIGGKDDDVLVAWYHSGSDGWLNGSFEIRVRHSPNHGASWGPIVTAVVDQYELPFWLGPFAGYHRWWGGMFPDVEIDNHNRAHIVYTHDPVENLPYPFAVSLTPEDGDIRYITSAGPPYNSWSSPITLNDDGLERAQGYPAMETMRVGKGTTVHVIWEDHRLSTTDNLYYDMFGDAKLGIFGWLGNFRFTDFSSINDWIFIGDYNDITASGGLVFAVWTDRRHQGSIFAFEDNVFGGYPTPLGKEAGPIAENGLLPENYALHQNYPNPFNPETVIRYELPEQAMVELRIYNLLGQEVRTLIHGTMPPGYHQAVWDGKDSFGNPVPSGVYVYVMRADTFTERRKMTLVR